jgi:hypothetical protein
VNRYALRNLHDSARKFSKAQPPPEIGVVPFLFSHFPQTQLIKEMPNTNLISEYPPTITENIPHLEPPNGAWAEPELFNRSIIQKLQDYGLGNSDCHSVKDSAILFCLMSGRDMMDWEKMEKAIVLVRSNARLHRHLVDVKAKGGYALMRKVMGGSFSSSFG